MSTVAFIPVRGGSKSISLKNIRLMCGKPLVYWVTKAACECGDIDRVYVSTDNDIIKKTVEEFDFSKVTVIERSAATATDQASTESAMLEFAGRYEFDDIVLIQATSPLLTSDDLCRGFHTYQQEGIDSVISVVRQKRFIWEQGDDGVKPINYDVFNRPRRQEFDGFLVENGAFYVTSREALLRSKNRVSGNIQAVEMSEETFYEIDEPSDWIIVEHLLKDRERSCDKGYEEILRNIKIFLTDSDGCLTDAGMYYSESGDELKKFNARDGYGIRCLKENGIIVGIVTGESRELLVKRAQKLKLDELHMGVDNKLEVVKELCQKYGYSLSNVAYVGDDLNDLNVIQNVGFGCAVADAQQEVISCAAYVTKCKGGNGAIREVADMLIQAMEDEGLGRRR